MKLENLTLAELKKLKHKLEQAIADFENRRNESALLELEKKAKELGFKLSDLAKAAARRERASSRSKYVNPNDKSQVWSGIGRRPQWFADAMAAGRTPDELLAYESPPPLIRTRT